MPKDPIIAIRDCLSEIAILHEIAARMTLDTFLTLMAWHDDNHLDQLARATEGKA